MRPIALRLSSLIVAAMAALTPLAHASTPVPPAPLYATHLTAVDGSKKALADLKGHPAVIAFWATWCANCREEGAELTALQERQPGLKVIGIALEDDPRTVHEFAVRHAFTHQLLLGGSHAMEIMRTLGNTKTAIPFTVAIDRSGTVVWARTGIVSRSELEAAAALAGK